MSSKSRLSQLGLSALVIVSLLGLKFDLDYLLFIGIAGLVALLLYLLADLIKHL